MKSAAKFQRLARMLDAAWEGESPPVEPLSEAEGLQEIADAYGVQLAWNALRQTRGERVIGKKIGLTSRAVQEQLGVNQPDFGMLWASRYFPVEGTQVEMPRSTFLQPRVEGELAFLLGQDLEGPHVTPVEVLSATEAVALSVEVVDSRIKDWRIKIYDTIADNASFGGFAVGPWQSLARYEDLSLLSLQVYQNGQVRVQGIGAAVLGHPARAVAWLANTLSGFGERLRAGDIVLSGAFAATLPVEQGDVVTACMSGFPPLTVIFI